MLGSRDFYCRFGDNEIFEFEAKKHRDEMYQHGCNFISAVNAHKQYNHITKIDYWQFDHWLPTFIQTHQYVQTSLFN